jgi:uncharacterized protein YndB with AHSA1/START domain
MCNYTVAHGEWYMMDKPALERSLWIAAPRERVWQAITDPKLLQQWFSPTTPWELSALEVGGKMYAVGYESTGSIIQVVDAPREFTLRQESPEPPLTITLRYVLEEENGGTRLNFSQFIVGDLDDAARARMIADYTGGWKMAYDNLKAYIEGAPLPFPEGL